MSDLVKFEAAINAAQTVEQLSPPLQNLFNFLVLLVDIEYRHRFGEEPSAIESVEDKESKGGLEDRLAV